MAPFVGSLLLADDVIDDDDAAHRRVARADHHDLPPRELRRWATPTMNEPWSARTVGCTASTHCASSTAIMPTSVRSNTNLTCMMLAGRIARWMPGAD